jgi:hypothetical protein
LTRRLIAAAVLIAAAGCAVKPIRLPAGSGAAAADAPSAFADATAACRTIKTFHANLRVSVRVGRGRIPPLVVGLAVTARHLGLTALSGATRVFTLAGPAEAATLIVRADDGERAVTAPAQDLLDATVGLRLSPADLLALSTGCVSPDLTLGPALRAGDEIVAQVAAGRLLLSRRTGRWRIAGGEMPAFAVAYESFDGDWPSVWRATTRAGVDPAASLDVRVDDPELQTVERGADEFAIVVPADAVRITIEELRALFRRQ